MGGASWVFPDVVAEPTGPCGISTSIFGNYKGLSISVLRGS